MPLISAAVDNVALLKDFDFPAHELKPSAVPFYELVSSGDVDSAINYVKLPPANFVRR